MKTKFGIALSALIILGAYFLSGRAGAPGRASDFRDAPRDNAAAAQLGGTARGGRLPVPVAKNVSKGSDDREMQKTGFQAIVRKIDAGPRFVKIDQGDRRKGVTGASEPAPYGQYRLVRTDLYCVVAKLAATAPPVNGIVSDLQARGFMAGGCTGAGGCVAALADGKSYGKAAGYLGSLKFVASLSKGSEALLVRLADQLPPMPEIQQEFASAGVKLVPFSYDNANYAAVFSSGADVIDSILALAKPDYVTWIGLNDDNIKAIRHEK